MRRAAILAALAVAACASCQLVYGLDDFHAASTTSSGAVNGGGGEGRGGGGSGADNAAGGANGCGSRMACVPTTLGEFKGYFNLIEGKPAGAPSQCASGAAPLHFYEGTPKGCSDCACGDPPSPACSQPGIYTWLVNSCIQGIGTPLGTFDGACVRNPGSFQVDAAKEKPCAATGGQLQETSFPTEATLCKINIVGRGCGRGETCAPSGAELCVVASGVVDCPSPWTKRRVVYASSTDSRACSTCTCSPEFTCQNGWNLFSSNDCSGMGTALAPGACSEAGSAIYQDLQPTGTLKCTPSMVQETGAFTPTKPSTICCFTP